MCVRSLVAGEACALNGQAHWRQTLAIRAVRAEPFGVPSSNPENTGTHSIARQKPNQQAFAIVQTADVDAADKKAPLASGLGPARMASTQRVHVSETAELAKRWLFALGLRNVNVCWNSYACSLHVAPCRSPLLIGILSNLGNPFGLLTTGLAQSAGSFVCLQTGSSFRLSQSESWKYDITAKLFLDVITSASRGMSSNERKLPQLGCACLPKREPL